MTVFTPLSDVASSQSQLTPSLPPEKIRMLNHTKAVLCCVCAVALIVWMLLFELWLAPIEVSPGVVSYGWGLKVLPLCVVLVFMFKGWLRAYQVVSLMVLGYLLEAVMRVLHESGVAQLGASGQCLLGLGLFVLVLLFLKPFKQQAKAWKKQQKTC